MIKKLENGYGFYCPICDKWKTGSEYLETVFVEKNQLWLSNMVTHYRHGHISWWNRCWEYRSGNYYRGNWFGDYDEEKVKVNEQAKRQIIRKCTDYLVEHEVSVSDFLALQNTSEKTVELLKKKLSTNRNKKEKKKRVNGKNRAKTIK